MVRWHVVELGEPLLERDRQQEPGQDLRSGLRDAQLLEHLVPVAVEALGLGLVAAVAGVGILSESCACHGTMLRRVRHH